MNTMKVAGVAGPEVTLDEAALKELKSSLRGALLLPNDDGYEIENRVEET